MQRLFASILFCAAAALVSAQKRDIHVADTDAMRANAAKHTEMVHQTVTLDNDQKTKVQEIYMEYERQLEGLNQRLDQGGFTKEEREAEMAPQWVSMEKALDEKLSSVLSGEQMGKWREARK
jgi:hypothetical protein